MDTNNLPAPTDECRNGICKHAMEEHISHLNTISDEQISEMLGAIVDTENLYISMHNEKDDDTKRIYYYLFRVSFLFLHNPFTTKRQEPFIETFQNLSFPSNMKLLRECLLNQQQPVIKGPLGDPPFESPSVAKAITNYVYLKYSHLNQQGITLMTEVAKAFLHCMNNWNFETPKDRAQTITNEDSAAYKINYTRWLMFCHVPAFCSSLPRYETTMVFGRTFLKSVFQVRVIHISYKIY